MRHKFIFLLAVLTLTFLNACKRDRPEDVISKSKMTEILIEQHLLEAKVLLLKVRTDSTNKVYNSLEQEIFEKYGVDKAMYEKSYQYYISKPELLDEIYEVVVDSLNVNDQHAAVLEEEEEKEKKRLAEEKKKRKQAIKDSIANIGKDSLTVSLSDSLALEVKEDSVAEEQEKPLTRTDSLRDPKLRKIAAPKQNKL
ncbi:MULTISPECIES: DUF4296 domain-containing protein [Reichenbachiella]|uniref:DUF4296 domain-containing protein n=1 Tax=Reichenbachiella TaxID=156993 RepID=UPI000E6B5FBB|nr:MULTISPECIES: DUF4296 domain-containing protein [Reichenbachiella]RJE75321.1 hypothetical protein BGP76_19715 [Reichenbachiella sp. MSK19-1]